MSARSRFRTVILHPSGLRAASIGSALLLILTLLIPVRITHAQTPSSEVVSWVHIGDLHMVDTTLSNYSDLKTFVNDINSYMKGGVNFAYLPGDNANDGTTSEYQLIHGVIQNLQVPLKAVPGDHDKKGQIADFKQYIYPKNPDSFDIGNYHFALVDSFNLQGQMSFLKLDLDAAKAAGKQSVLMLHQFDVNQLGSDLQTLIQTDNVILVDAGHTHTNVLANDGHTVYAATRSTGQATEGPVGVSLESLDHGIVSWHFQPLGQWPFVSITSPADQGLLINSDQVVKGTTAIHVKAFSNAAISSVSYQVDGGARVTMNDRGNSVWSGAWNAAGVSDGAHTIEVTVTDANGKTGTDEIKALVSQSGAYSATTKSFGPEGNTLSTNASKGLLGASGAGGAKGGGKGSSKPGGKAGPGPKACTSSNTTSPTPVTTATTTSASVQKGSHGKGHGGCSAPGGGTEAKGGKGIKGRGKHAPKGKAACTTSSTTIPTPTTTATSTSPTTRKGGHGKGHAGCGGPGAGRAGGKGAGKHGPKGPVGSAVSPGVPATPIPTAVNP